MDLRLVEVMANARRPIDLNVKAGNRVLIVADTQTEPLVWQSLAAACVQVGAEPTVTIMVPRAFPHYDPTPEVAAAMMQADVNILVTSKAIIHSATAHAAMGAGHPCIACEELTADMMTQGGATADYVAMQHLGKRVLETWNRGNSVRVTSDLGTDLTANIAGRKGWAIAGILTRQEGMDLYCCAFPDGEAGITPIENTTNGVVVFDMSAHYLGKILEPIKLVVRNGVVVEILGGPQAVELERCLTQYGDQYSHIVGEIAIGLNEAARVTGVIREDKKMYGTVHIGLGRNSDVGGLITCKTHVDGVIRYPSVWVDDRLVVDHGKIKI